MESVNNCYGIIRIKEGTTKSPVGRDIPWRETYSNIPGYDSLPPGEYHLIRVDGKKDKMILFKKEYDGESLYDLERDVTEAVQEDFNALVAIIPPREDGTMRGTFKVTIEWEDDV